MKKFFIFAAALATLASCTKNASIEEAPVADNNAIGFSAYTGTTATKGTVVEAANLYGTEAKKGIGIGIFAFYQPGVGTTKQDFTTRKFATPDFMYNQQLIKADASALWTYNPVKYWPNNTYDQISFFAYAPYDPNKTWEDMGISTDVNGNEISTEFMIEEDPISQIDFLWTDPQVNLTKQKVNTSVADGTHAANPINFQFAHVLSQINLEVGVEQNTAAGTPTNWYGDTKIVVNSIAFKGVYDKISYKKTGSAAGAWTGSGSQDVVMDENDFTPYSVINSSNYSAGGWQPLTKAGSTLFLAPQDATAQDVEIEITYTVTTPDDNLPGKESVVVNKISKKLSTITGTSSLDGKFVANQSYKLKFLIGMNQVTLIADVTPWADVLEQKIDVPANE